MMKIKANGLLPDEYKDIDMWKYCLDRCPDETEHENEYAMNYICMINTV